MSLILFKLSLIFYHDEFDLIQAIFDSRLFLNFSKSWWWRDDFDLINSS
jgi:hypothetical protein